MKGLEAFLSEGAILAHKEHLNNLKLRYSILEKSFPGIFNRELRDIEKMRLEREVKREITDLKSEILCHELYFSSYANRFGNSKIITERFGSSASFLYNLKCIAMSGGEGFLVIYEKREELLIYCGAQYSEIFIRCKPLLSLDLCEHAYFTDYGFLKEKYVEAALSYLDLSVIDKNNL